MPDAVITRRATQGDAVAIAEIHVAGWRSAYPGILPDRVLLGLSPARIAPHYAASILRGRPVRVATEAGRPVGFATGSVARGRDRLADGVLETLYVLDDWRDRGFGRALVGAIAADLVGLGCRSMLAQVLSDNPSLWFYRRLGAVASLRSTTRVGGAEIAQTAMLWSDLAALAAPVARG